MPDHIEGRGSHRGEGDDTFADLSTDMLPFKPLKKVNLVVSEDQPEGVTPQPGQLHAILFARPGVEYTGWHQGMINHVA